MTHQSPSRLQLVEGRFDDIDALAESAVEWDQEYEQIGRGRFHGHLTQLLVGDLQLGREGWSPGVLQRGAAPAGTWIFGLTLFAHGSLHARRRPIQPSELIAATSRDDIGFSATGPTEMMIVAIPTTAIDRWVQVRRGKDRFDISLPLPHWQVPPADMTRRAGALAEMLETLTIHPNDHLPDRFLSQIEAQIFEVILDMIPSADVIEPLHNRARIARELLSLLRERYDDPPTITELCILVGAKERTLHLSCVEAFGRPPGTLLAELRLNAAHRALRRPDIETTVAVVAMRFGFTHFGRFSSIYRRHFGELPSETLSRARGG